MREQSKHERSPITGADIWSAIDGMLADSGLIPQSQIPADAITVQDLVKQRGLSTTCATKHLRRLVAIGKMQSATTIRDRRLKTVFWPK